MRSLSIAVSALGALLIGSHVLAAAASAAMWAAVTVSPASPTVGKPAEVLIRTFATYGSDDLGAISQDGQVPAPSGFNLVLWAVEYPFEVMATGPRGESIAVNVQRDPNDGSLYRGMITFVTPGEWTLRLPQLPGPDDAPGIRLAVSVSEPTPESNDTLFLAILASAAFGVLVGIVAIRLLRRREVA